MIVLGLIAGALSALQAVSARADTAAPVASTADATAQAAATGQPVEVPGYTTETTQVMANPDGTFTLTSNRDPVRVQQDGQWVPIDTTLVRDPDGSYRPKAALAELSFSGGGTGPALTLGDPNSDAAVSFSWPSPLPAPVVDGATATYPNVLPGVDLRLTADSDRYSDVLVVHDAAAATDPQLNQLKLTVTAHHVELTRAGDGGLTGLDDSGAVVFDGSPPIMWDSAFDSQYGGPPSAEDPAGADTTLLPTTVPTVDGIDGTASSTLTLTPPSAALTGPDVQYPVYIDPTMNPTVPSHFLVVSGGTTSLHYYDTGSDLKVGDCDWGTSCNNIGVARSFFNFNITALTAPQPWQDDTPRVYSAEVKVYQIHNAAGCTAEPVELWTTPAFTSATVWPGPAYSSLLQTVSTGYSDTCGAGTSNYDDFTASIIGTKVSYAATIGNAITFGLHSPNEADRNQWKRFGTNASLTVVYSYAPSRTQADGFADAINCNGKIYVPDAFPTFRGQAQDNNDPHVPMYLDFYVYKNGSTTVSYGSDPSDDPLVGAAQSNTAIGWKIKSALTNGQEYQYTVNAHLDVTDGSSQYGTLSSRYDFTVATGPTKQPTVSSGDYPAGQWGMTAATASSPRSFLATDSEPAVVGFSYKFDSGTVDKPNSCAAVQGSSVLSSTGSASIPAPIGLAPGRHTLTVASFNGALALGPATTYTFYVAPTTADTSPNVRQAEDTTLLSYGGGAPSTNALDLQRYLVGTDRVSIAGPTAPTGGTLQTGLGLVLADPLLGTVPLYDCIVNSDRFSSTSATCEGKTRNTTPPIGYLFLTAPTVPSGPSTHPLYRCRTATEHYDSISPTCDGDTVDGVLGYVLDGMADGSPTQNSLSAGAGYRFVASSQSTVSPPSNTDSNVVTIGFTPTVSADYAFGAQLVTSPANGKINFSISAGSTPVAALGPNGQPGDVDDSSSSTEESYVPLGGAHLIAGTSYTLVGRVDAAGVSGGYYAGIDYLTIAPISNLTATPDNVGTSADGTNSNANLDATTPAMSLSQQALAAQGYVPGGLFTAADGVSFPVPGYAAGGYDNMLASGDQYVFASTPTAMQEVDLLVAATGTATPQNDAGYVVSLNYGQGDFASLEQAELPSVPNWQAAADSSQVGVPDPTGSMTTKRELGLSLAYYNSGSAPVTQVNTAVSLYVIRIPLDPTAGPLTSINLPSGSYPGVHLHVFAVTVH